MVFALGACGAVPHAAAYSVESVESRNQGVAGGYLVDVARTVMTAGTGKTGSDYSTPLLVIYDANHQFRPPSGVYPRRSPGPHAVVLQGHRAVLHLLVHERSRP